MMPCSVEGVLVVTAADSNYFYLVMELIASIRSINGPVVDIAVYDLGLTDEQVTYLRTVNVRAARPITGFDVPASANTTLNLSCLARPFLPQNFPGYTTYVWLDSDSWVQSKDALRTLIDTANQTGAAYIREDDPTYKSNIGLHLWKCKHYILGYGVWLGLRLLFKKQINNGVFAMRADAPHWVVWQKFYQSALSRTATAAPHDQFSLNAAAYFGKLETEFLPAIFNWICDLSHPDWDDDEQCFCTPSPRRQRIGIIHLAGPIKTTEFDIRTTRGGLLRGTFRYGGILPKSID